MTLKESQTREGYLKLWSAMTIRPGKTAALAKVVEKIAAGRNEYEAVESETGVPWWAIGILHMREASCDFKTYLGNGEPLSRVTRLVPKGRGPFEDWHDGAADALRLQGYAGLSGWDLPTALHRMEAFNGWGYFYKGVNSPYMWSWTSQYTAGKFVADHKFSATAVDPQPGCAAMLRGLIDAGLVTLDAAAAVEVPLKLGARGEDVSRLQSRLRALGYPVGLADGVYGPSTRRAVLLLQDEHDLTGTPGEFPASYWPVLDAAKPIVSAERAATTEADLRAAGDGQVAKLSLLQRVLAFFGLSSVATGTLQSFPETATAIQNAVDPVRGLIGWASGNLWLICLAAAIGLIVLVRYLMHDHVEAFKSGAIQGDT